jgi:hypothetical protein
MFKHIKSQSHSRWTDSEHQLLLEMVNKHVNGVGGSRWKGLRPLEGRTLHACEQRWSAYLKERCVWNGSQYELISNRKVSTTAPKSKRATKRTLNKRVTIKKSFLWGAFTFERYE